VISASSKNANIRPNAKSITYGHHFMVVVDCSNIVMQHRIFSFIGIAGRTEFYQFTAIILLCLAWLDRCDDIAGC
jgi:hypothetical protein